MDAPTQQTEGGEIAYARHAHFTPPHLSKQQFVTVLEGDALVVLKEVNDHLFMVKVCRTGFVGLIPAGKVEGALERTARVNMEANCRTLAERPPSAIMSTWKSAGSTPAFSDIRSTADEAKIESRPALRRVRSVDPGPTFRYPSENYMEKEWSEESEWMDGWMSD